MTRRRDGPCEIAIVHYAAPPVVGGVETIIGRHAQLMADDGHAVRIVAGRGESLDARVRFEPIRLADSAAPEVLAVNSELAVGRVTPAFRALSDTLEAQVDAAIAGADLVFVHNIASMNRNLALTAALRRIASRPEAARFVLWYHDLAWQLPQYSTQLHAGEPWSLLRTPWPGVESVTISQARRRDLASLIGVTDRAITVVPGGVDVPTEHATVANPPEAGPRRTDDENGPLLLTPARVTPRKNLELAIAVVAELRARGRPTRLVVTGPVDPHDALGVAYLTRLITLRRELGLDDCVTFLAESPEGSASPELMQELYAGADVVFLPSFDEGFGLPIIEAAAHLVPIVCSDLPSLREIGGANVTYIDPKGDPRLAADAVLAAIDLGPSPDLARRVEAEYSWRVIYAGLIRPLIRRALLRS